MTHKDIYEMNRNELIEAAEQRLLKMPTITDDMYDVLIDKDSSVGLEEQCIWILESDEQTLRQHAQEILDQ